ncbi:MAG: proteasome-activating nucleotidase [Methanomassiliicoccales archaeon]
MADAVRVGADEEIYKRLLILEERNSQLMEQARKIEGEKKFLQTEFERVQRELKRLRTELERLKAPPLIIGNIRDIFSDGRVSVKSSTGPDFVVNVAEGVDPTTLSIGARVALNKQTLAVMGLLPSSLDPIVMGAEVIEKPDASYSDIGGLQKQLVEVREAVEDPLLRPELYRKVGIEPPKGVLLVGPPGTGKTLIAKAVAHNTHATFIRLVGSELVQKYIGEGARLVRELFELARKKAPSIVFVDELDSVGAKRLDVATSGDREVQRTLMQLLAEMDGFNPLENVRIIGASNRPDILDEALLRPGRFDRIVRVPPPNSEARIEIFRIHTKRMNLEGSIDFEDLAIRTDGATGADIHSICTEAGMLAIRDGRDSVNFGDFEKAIQKVLEGEEETKQQFTGEAGPMFA